MTATMTSSTSSASKSGCGCGGSSSSKISAPCSCATAECLVCENEAYVRPKFFAGQLLTEDDLQQLSDYVTAKNRLHNRYLWGSGVVWGLDVRCHPCGHGRVLVNPGYAIDCCGNDIVLTCPRELDVNKMVRDLQLKLRGSFDCDDPCAKDETTTTATTLPANRMAAEMVNTSEPVRQPHGEKPKSSRRKYCLYVNYCEQPSDPVSPYATDQPCVAPTCEPTRIREGFHFELRCPDREEEESPLCNRLRDCVGESALSEQNLKDAETLNGQVKKIALAAKRIHSGAAPKVSSTNVYAATLKTIKGKLQQFKMDSIGFGSAKDHPQEFQKFQDTLLQAGTQLALLKVLNQSDRRKLERVKVVSPLLTEVRELLTSFIRKAKVEELREVLPTALECAYTTSLLKVLSEVLSDQQGRSQGVPAPAVSMEMRFLAEGAVFTGGLQNAVVDSLTSLREWSLRQLERTQTGTHFGLLPQLDALTLPAKSFRREMTESEALLLERPAALLVQAVPKITKSCFCDALIPPCPSCTDTGVQLACLIVEDCAVQEICNLDRTFVITPVAARYWIPQIQMLEKILEEWCCISGCEEADEGAPDKQFPELRKRIPAPVQSIMRMWESACFEAKRSVKTIPRPRLEIPISAPPSYSLLRSMIGYQEAPAVEGKTVEMTRMIDIMCSKLETMRTDYKKVLDRIAKLEKG